MSKVPEPVLRAIKSIEEQYGEFIETGEPFAVSDGYACFLHEKREGVDVSYPAYTITPDGVISEVPQLTDEWFALLRLSHGYDD